MLKWESVSVTVSHSIRGVILAIYAISCQWIQSIAYFLKTNSKNETRRLFYPLDKEFK